MQIIFISHVEIGTMSMSLMNVKGLIWVPWKLTKTAISVTMYGNILLYIINIKTVHLSFKSTI